MKHNISEFIGELIGILIFFIILPILAVIWLTFGGYMFKVLVKLAKVIWRWC